MLNVGGSRASYARCVLPILAPRSDYVGLAPLPEHHGCWPKGNDDLLSNEKIVHAKVTVGYNHALAEHDHGNRYALGVSGRAAIAFAATRPACRSYGRFEIG